VLIFEGKYLNGKKQGKGKEYHYKYGLIFDGEFLDGKRWNGIGIEVNEDDQIIFRGKYLNGERQKS